MATIKTAKAIRERLHAALQTVPTAQIAEPVTGALLRTPSFEEFAELVEAVSDLLTMLDEDARFKAETAVGPSLDDLDERLLALEAQGRNFAHLLKPLVGANGNGAHAPASGEAQQKSRRPPPPPPPAEYPPTTTGGTKSQPDTGAQAGGPVSPGQRLIISVADGPEIYAPSQPDTVTFSRKDIELAAAWLERVADRAMLVQNALTLLRRAMRS